MYPNEPYPGFSWPLNHHIGKITPHVLHHVMLAAAMFTDARDWRADITNYLIVNDIFTANIRTDSGQAETWRDYQQIFSELGFIYSSEVTEKIKPTAMGLSLLDGSMDMAEVITLQVLRLQYPNGHKLQIDDKFKKYLSETPYANYSSLAALQLAAGVQIRPAVLIWKLLRSLDNQGLIPQLSLNEIQSYAMRCATHADLSICALGIAAKRAGGTPLGLVPRGRRDAQEWIRLLGLTPLFATSKPKARNMFVAVSEFGRQNADAIDIMCTELEQPETFWTPGLLDREDRRSWYMTYGNIDLSIALIPEGAPQVPGASDVAQAEANEDKGLDLAENVRQFQLTPFDATTLGSDPQEGEQNEQTIVSSYNAGLANEKRRLHHLMVIYIAKVCTAKGAQVLHDLNTVDLLVNYKDIEFLVEVKSVTSRNFISRLRYAIGQILQYEYMRSLQTNKTRRKVIAVAAQVPRNTWCVPFVNEHLGMDLLSLKSERLQVDSKSNTAIQLFTPTSNDLNLGI